MADRGDSGTVAVIVDHVIMFMSIYESGQAIKRTFVIMIIVKSVNQIPIRLTIERWDHITFRHPEMEDQKDRVLETISSPHLIQLGDLGALIAIRFYDKTPLTSKYLVVVYKEINNDGFVITAYFTAEPSERRQIVWKQ